jgi:hypothetical protein
MGTFVWQRVFEQYENPYYDWQEAAVDRNLSILHLDFRSRPPKPYNKGDDWYPEAVAAIEADVTRWVNVEVWRKYRRRFHIVHENSDTFEALTDV